MRSTAPKDAAEIEALETREWLESLDYVLQSGGPARVSRLLAALSVHARQNGVTQPFTANTPYVNTIPPADQPPFPGSREIEEILHDRDAVLREDALRMELHAVDRQGSVRQRHDQAVAGLDGVFVSERRTEQQSALGGELGARSDPVGDALGVVVKRAGEVAVAPVEAGGDGGEGGGHLVVVEAQDV